MKNKYINIKLKSNRVIGSNQKCFIIAEAGVNHNGKLSYGKKLIDIAAAAGADAVKFQTFNADEIILKKAPKAKYHIETTGSDKQQSWYELLKTQEINFEMHKQLIEYCKKKKILFMSTPYDKKSVDLLNNLDVEIFKIASSDINNFQLIEYIAKKGKPVILSTAMSNLNVVQTSVKILKRYLKDKFVIMQCTGSYPAPLNEANLNVIKTYKKKFNCLVGYSDHVMGEMAALASIPLGICCYEKHITINKRLPGPDHRASLEKKEFANLVRNIRKIELSLGDGKKVISKPEMKNHKKLKKYFVATKNINKGDIITENSFTAKRTGGKGVSAADYYKLLNSRAKRKFKINHIIKI